MNCKLFKEYIKDLPKNSKVLDAGCGKGQLSKYIHNLRPDLKIYCIDSNPAVKKDLPPYVKFSNKSITDLKGFNAGMFDCVLCFHVLEHITDPKKAVSEFGRILKKGGLVIAETPHWTAAITPLGNNFYDDPTHIRPYSKKGFEELFRNFSILYLNVEEPSFFHLANFYQNEYNMKKGSVGYIFKNLLRILRLYKIVVFIIAKKE